jgi:hypothetical protein
MQSNSPNVDDPVALRNVLPGTHRTTLDEPGKSSDGANCKELCFVSLDPLVVTVGPDQLNYGTQPKGAMILRRED